MMDTCPPQHTDYQADTRLQAWHSARARLLVIIMTSLLLLATLLALISTILHLRNAENQILEHLTSVASIQEARIDSWAAGLRADLATQLTEPERTWMEMVITRPAGDEERLAAQDHLSRAWAAAIQASEDFSEIALIDRQGMVVLPTETDQANRTLIPQRRFLAGQTTSKIQPSFDAEAPWKTGIITQVPIMNAQAEMIGVLAGRTDVQALTRIVQEAVGIDPTIEIYLLAPDNELLAQPLPKADAGSTPASANSRIQTDITRHENEPPTNRQASYHNAQNVPVFGVYRWLPALDMALVIEQTHVEALAPLVSILIADDLTVFVGTALIMLVALFMTRRVMTPLDNLISVSRQIADDTFKPKIATAREDDLPEQLEATIAKLHFALQVAKIGVFEFDPHTQALTWSDQVYEIFGVDPSEGITLERYESMLKPEDYQRAMAVVARAIETKTPYEIERSIVSATTGEKHIVAIGQPVLNDNHQVVKIFGTIQDITERKEAEIGLERERSLLRTLIDHLPDMIYVKDRDSRIIISNAALTALLKRDHEREIVGMTGVEYFPEAFVDRYLQDDRHVIQSGSTILNRQEELENPDGQSMHLLTTKLPLRDPAGEIIGLIGISRDVTDLMRAEETLRKSEQRYRSLFQESPVPLWEEDMSSCKHIINQLRAQDIEDLGAYLDQHPETLWDMAKSIRLIDANRAALDFYQIDDLTAFWDFQMNHWTDQALQQFQLEIGMLTQGISSHTGSLRHHSLPDGKEITILLHTAIPVEHLETWAHVYVSTIDMTQQVWSAQALRELNNDLEQRVIQRTQELMTTNKELESFAYSISHDLRTPLRAINGYCQIIIEDYGDRLDNDGHEYLQRTRAATRRMGQIIDDLLALSRVTRSELVLEPVDLSAVVREISSTLQKVEPERAVEWSIADDVVTVVDRQLMQVALENLIGNAWKFTSKKPLAQIAFGKTVMHDRPAYFVRDNGAGFDTQYIGKIFEPFQRLHRSEDFEGTGIGLATVARIIQRHVGVIWAESELDLGTTFYFILNLLDNDDTHHEQEVRSEKH